MFQRCPTYTITPEMDDLLNRMNRLAGLATQTREPEILEIIKITYKILENQWENLREKNEMFATLISN